MQDLDETIRERAYHLWVADGCPDGNAETHWLIAQRDVLASSFGGLAAASESTGAKKVAKKKGASAPKRKSRAA